MARSALQAQSQSLVICLGRHRTPRTGLTSLARTQSPLEDGDDGADGDHGHEECDAKGGDREHVGAGCSCDKTGMQSDAGGEVDGPGGGGGDVGQRGGGTARGGHFPFRWRRSTQLSHADPSPPIQRWPMRRRVSRAFFSSLAGAAEGCPIPLSGLVQHEGHSSNSEHRASSTEAPSVVPVLPAPIWCSSFVLNKRRPVETNAMVHIWVVPSRW
ncbi:hypothetical protein L1887_58073 [Cichorium endivia]|nr:hypothetical protein L1887_58073 [Cichorium endivia]